MMSSPISVDYSKLYRFDDPFATRPFRLRSRLPVGSLPGNRSHLLAQGKFAFDEPIQFDAASGGHAADVLWSQMRSKSMPAGEPSCLIIMASL